MFTEFIPLCPRLHPGMMVSDDSRYAKEWFCRSCGTRLYGNDQGGAELPQTSPEKPINESGIVTGKRRNIRTHYVRSKERNRKHQGKWYE